MIMKYEHTCQDCGYFRPHYIWSRRYQAIDYGHCVHPPRTRHRRPESAACIKWTPQTATYQRDYVPPSKRNGAPSV